MFLVLANVSIICNTFSTYIRASLGCVGTCSSMDRYNLMLFTVLVVGRATYANTMLRVLSRKLVATLFFTLVNVVCKHARAHSIHRLDKLVGIVPFLSMYCIVTNLTGLKLPKLDNFITRVAVFINSFRGANMFCHAVAVVTYADVIVATMCVLHLMNGVLCKAYAGGRRLTLASTA